MMYRGIAITYDSEEGMWFYEGGNSNSLEMLHAMIDDDHDSTTKVMALYEKQEEQFNAATGA